METFKGLNKSDVYISDYISRKNWTVDIDRFSELGITVDVFESGSAEYASLVQSFYRGVLEDGSVSGSYDPSLQTTITVPGCRQIGSRVTVLSIPRECFDVRIEEQSIWIEASGDREFRDREGILFDKTGEIVGDVIYTKGLILLRENYPENDLGLDISILHWTSCKPIFTSNTVCRVRDVEMNYTNNPTAKTLEEDRSVEFYPYITSIGLYNTANELMAVAKLSKPIRKVSYVDMTFKVSIDLQ